MEASALRTTGSDRTEGRRLLGEPFHFSQVSAAPIVATAIHAGHDLRPEVARLMRLDESTRLREEDPFTDQLAAVVDATVVVNRSRFEVDLNRQRDQCIYRTPADAWGLDVWTGDLPEDVVSGSLALYDSFYGQLAGWLDPLAANGPFIVFDMHSYNHRRQGPDHPPDPKRENPDINVGTGSLDRDRWAPVVDAFIETLDGVDVCGHRLDVRENVRFRGANLTRWVHERYPARGCALALEFKKTFMDEWTGAVNREHLARLADVVRQAIAPCLRAARAAT